MSAAGDQRGVEWLCVGECLRFSRRHRRYLVIFVSLYLHSLRHWAHARAARYGFCFLQLYDDIMDGDRATATSPDDVAAQTIAAWETGAFRQNTTLERIGRALHAALHTVPLLPGDDPHGDVLALLRAMHVDARRIATASVLTASEVKEQLRGTFHHSLNVLLIASRLRTRAREVPDLVEAMGWCSVARDLDEDLRKGLVNVPSEVVARVHAAGDALTSRHPEVQRWLALEKMAVRSHLDGAATELHAIARRDPGAGQLLGLFLHSIERYAR